jgi:mono/diheme cytochrome c family protein
MTPFLSSRFFLPAVLFGSLLFLAACSTPPGNPENGKKWFLMNNCSACHGPHGNDGKAPHIAGLDLSFGSFLRKLRSADSAIMPEFPESKVSKQDAADIYAYLKSIK